MNHCSIDWFSLQAENITFNCAQRRPFCSGQEEMGKVFHFLMINLDSEGDASRLGEGKANTPIILPTSYVLGEPLFCVGCWVAVHWWLNSHRFLQRRSSTLCAKVKNLQLRRKSGFPIWGSLREKLMFLPRQKVNLIHLQLWERGYVKGVPIFLRERSVVSHPAFLRVFGGPSMFSAASQRQDDFRMKHIYVKCYENL